MSRCMIVLLQSAELSSLTDMARVLCRWPLTFSCMRRNVSMRRRRQSMRGACHAFPAHLALCR